MTPTGAAPIEGGPRVGIAPGLGDGLMRAIGTDVIVAPLYDPDTVETGLSPGCPGLYMPGSAKNPMSQQGIVVAAGPDQEVIQAGDHILYHPFVQSPMIWSGKEYLRIRAHTIVGILNKEGELLPLPWDVVIKPDFAPAGRPVKVGALWIPRQVFEIEVPATGIVVRCGHRVTLVSEGQRVVYPMDAGNEIGLREVWYTINEKDLLAVVLSDVPVKITTTPMQRAHHAQGTN